MLTLRERAVAQLEVINQDEYIAWLEHPITRALILHLKADIEDLKDGWVNGAYTTEHKDGTDQLNARMLGQAQQADLILDLILSLKISCIRNLSFWGIIRPLSFNLCIKSISFLSG